MIEEPNVKNARVEVGKTPDAETGRSCAAVIRGVPVSVDNTFSKAAACDLHSRVIPSVK